MNTQKNPAWPAPFSPDPGLYLVATPIGHLRDMTLRGLDVLEAADLVLCEDTRVSAKLLNAYGLKKPLRPYHDHSSDKDRAYIISRLQAGEIIALISDAGMPLIADPGYKLVRECYRAGLAVYSLPGANALLAALQLSGLPSDRFCFYGFMPAKAGERQRMIEGLSPDHGPAIFYETAGRLLKTLADLPPQTEVAVARELTKKFEEVKYGTAEELICHYESHTLKGEIVLLINPPEKQIDLDKVLYALLKDHSVKDAAQLTATQTGLPKKDIYARALEIKNEG